MDDVATGSVTALVLAAGESRRLGQAKQLLAFRGATLLDATIGTVTGFGLSQTIVTLGGSASDVRREVQLEGVDVVESVRHTEGCSSSIVSALDVVDPAADGILLFLGDQPGVAADAVSALLSAAATGADIAVTRYRDGTGHPFWFSRAMFRALADLRGDKAVWKLLESDRCNISYVPVDVDTPLDVDTWDDYQRLLATG